MQTVPAQLAMPRVAFRGYVFCLESQAHSRMSEPVLRATSDLPCELRQDDDLLIARLDRPPKGRDGRSLRGARLLWGESRLPRRILSITRPGCGPHLHP